MVKGFKAFNKGLSCRGFQFEEGKTYEHKGDFIPCNSGFHFCENPLDVLNYYDLCNSEFAMVEAVGEVKKEDNKTVTNKLKIGIKLNLPGFIKASIEYVSECCKQEKSSDNNDSAQLASSGDSAQLASSGDSAKLASSGDSSKIASSGDSSKLAIEGKYSLAAGIGINNKIKGIIGTWITLAEWEFDNSINKYVPLCVKSAQIDGEILKENIYYKLENSEFVEVE